MLKTSECFVMTSGTLTREQKGKVREFRGNVYKLKSRARSRRQKIDNVCYSGDTCSRLQGHGLV
jgi:hypothetical protein